MTTGHEQDWGNYWQGRAAQDSGEALVGVGIENNAVLTNLWTDFFGSFPKTARVVDFACGAGSAIKHAHAAGLTALTGVDIAEEAITVLQAAIPNVTGIVSPVTQTSLAGRSVDIVVSQFGFEYAGDQNALIEAAREMARVLADGGSFKAVTHIKGGAIEQESQAALAQIKFISDSEFISRAKDMFRAVYASDRQPSAAAQETLMQALMRMSEAEGPVVQWLKSPAAQGNEFARFGHYLITSTREMFTRHTSLELEDCVKWLDDMDAEIGAYKGRMASMVGAAIDAETAAKILSVFDDSGFTPQPPKPLYFNENDLPVAWVLEASGIG